MSKRLILACLFTVTVGYSAAALADRHHFEVTAEAYGHTSEEAIDNALYYAYQKCYLSWGESDQDYTVLAQWIDEETGYPSARVSLGCTTYD